MEHSTLLFGITLAFYCISGALFLWDLVKGVRLAGLLASGVAVIGLLVQSAGIVLRSLEQHHAPFTNLFGSLMFFAWALMAV
ncbi:MAG: hypothetical protein NTU88_08765, partial [Armatimonadetes bacterium]|nr:hypothetical protein [Armatimonadota bacterium]